MRKENSIKLPMRQIHLDFHTSPLVPEIGKKFNPEKFAEVLQNSHVQSITCFARCHHGMMYYDSMKYPERIHPNLVHKNMLKEMIDACHKRGIKVPVYTTVQWDIYSAEEHPEWVSIDQTGKQIGQEPYKAGFYQALCVNTGYGDFLKEHIRELFESLDVDGIFLDVLYPRDCSCAVCRKKMREEGIDIYDAEARIQYNQKMLNDFKREITEMARSYKKDATVFYNTSHIGVKQREILDAYSHLELESIPGGWGYVHFPVTMRYARTLGIDCVSHTGGFHVEWGDLHSFKTQEALEYECFRMLALGCKCLIGDQMEADGELIAPLYDKIREVYEKVEAVEPWCEEVQQVVEAGVLTPEEFFGGDRGNLNSSLMGLEYMFDKIGLQFDIIDTKADFEEYPLLVLPDCIPVDEVLKKKLEDYCQKGGKLFISFESGFSPDGSVYMLKEETGIRSFEETVRTLDGEKARGILCNTNDYAQYILPGEEIGKNLPKVEHIMYSKGVEIGEVEENVKVLSSFIEPYFYRDYRHFSSHRQAPSTHEKGAPAIIQKGSVIYFASPIFAIYNSRAPKWCLELVKDAIVQLNNGQMVEHNGPSTLFVSVNEQKAEKRYVLHLLHYIPEKIAEDLHTVEDKIPLYNIKLSLQLPKEIAAIKTVPDMTELEGKANGSRVEFTVPIIDGYQIIELDYE